MASQSDIVSQMRQMLNVSDPDLDTSTGTVTRKILDVTAEVVSEAYVDNHILTYQYDIDSKTDADLDAFVQLFGMARYPARRATGTVTFSRAASTTFTVVPINTQVNSNTDPMVSVLTITTGIMEIGQLSVTVPVQALVAGPDGDLPAGTLVAIATPLTGITAVTNAATLTGGSFQETDDQLRDRWKKTVFRNMAGTESMFLGVAVNDPDCTSANVVGSAKRRREQLQIVSGVAISTVADAKYVYNGTQMMGLNIDTGDVAVPGIHYTWDTTDNPPQVVIIDTATFPDGTLIDLDFGYVPTASRNDPVNAIANRIDVWCAGTRAIDASQSLIFKNTATFSNTSTSIYYKNNYIRPDGTRPVAANVFIPLAFGPIVTLPSTIVIGATTYGLATPAHAMGTTSGSITYAYQIVHEDNANGWHTNSRFGLEWDAAHQPTLNSAFSIVSDYTYNDVPWAVQQDIDAWRLAGSDAKAHQAKQIFLKFNLAVIYDYKIDRTLTSTAVDVALADFLGKLGFNAVVQASDILQVVHNVPGVDAVRFLHGTDISGWDSGSPNNYTVGIQQIIGSTVVASYVDTNGYAKDVILDDMQVPAFGLSVQVIKAENSWTP
jgi:uncharacterized phage protein gp47/JayE